MTLSNLTYIFVSLVMGLPIILLFFSIIYDKIEEYKEKKKNGDRRKNK